MCTKSRPGRGVREPEAVPAGSRGRSERQPRPGPTPSSRVGGHTAELPQFAARLVSGEAPPAGVPKPQSVAASRGSVSTASEAAVPGPAATAPHLHARPGIRRPRDPGPSSAPPAGEWSRAEVSVLQRGPGLLRPPRTGPHGDAGPASDMCVCKPSAWDGPLNTNRLVAGGRKRGGEKKPKKDLEAHRESESEEHNGGRSPFKSVSIPVMTAGGPSPRPLSLPIAARWGIAGRARSA